MSRVICQVCQRPEKVCLCPWIKSIENRIELGILQHPTEVSQIKGTAKIAQLSLQDCCTWVLEDVDSSESFQAWLNNGEKVFLLYPGIDNQVEPFESFGVERLRSEYPIEKVKFLVLDGTWRKTHKMMMLSSQLRGLNRITLTPTKGSNYQIRKQKNQQSLSTVEALFELYSQAENDVDKYQSLLNAFESMQNQQLVYRNKPG